MCKPLFGHLERKERVPRRIRRRKRSKQKKVGCFGVAIREPLLASWPFSCMVCIVSKVVHEHCNHNFDILIKWKYF